MVIRLAFNSIPMKISPSRFINYRHLMVAITVIAMLGAKPGRAASGSWNVNASGAWSGSSNWVSNVIPGTTSGTASTDIATFGTTLTTATGTVTLDANRNVGGIVFSSTGAFGYSLGGGAGNLLLSNSGTILRSGTVGAHTDTITRAIAIQGNGGSAFFTNNATLTTSLLTVSGGISGVSTSGSTTTLTLNGSNTGINQLSGIISDGGTGKLALVKSDAGQWRLTGNNTFSGGVTLNAGTLGIGTTNNVLGSGALTINGGSLTNLTAGNNYGNAVVVGGDFTLNAAAAFTLSGNVDLGAATRTITASTSSGNTVTLSGTISNGGLNKVGPGTLVLSGTNTFTGGVSISEGMVSANTIANSGAASALGAGNSIAIGATTISGTLEYTGTGGSTNRTVDLAGTTGGAFIVNNGSGALVFTSNFTASGLGVKALNLGGSNTSAANELQGVIVDSGTRTSLVKRDAGTWTLSGTASHFTGATTINDGILRLGNDGVLSNDTTLNTLTVNKGSLELNGHTQTTAGLTLGNATTTVAGATANVVDAVGGGKLTLFGNVVYNAGSATFNNGQGTISGNLDLNGAVRSFTIADSDQAVLDTLVSGTILNSTGTGRLTKAGAGVMALTAANTYTGTTTISAGTLQLGNGGTTGSLSASSAIVNNANLTFNRSNALSQGTDFNSVISGSGSVTQAGTGTTTLSGANTYTGATAVSVGTLVINGSVATSSGVSVSSGATLAGSGRVSSLSGAGSINPGNSPGILTATSLDMSGGLDFKFELTATGNPTWSVASSSVNDVLHLTNTSDPFASTSATSANVFDIYLGVASLGGGDVFNGGLFASPTGGDFGSLVSGGIYNYYVLGDGGGSHLYNGANYYTLAEYNALLSAAWAINEGTLAVNGANFATGTVDGYVQEFTVVPEPSTWALLLIGFTPIVVLHRRQRTKV